MLYFVGGEKKGAMKRKEVVCAVNAIIFESYFHLMIRSFKMFTATPADA